MNEMFGKRIRVSLTVVMLLVVSFAVVLPEIIPSSDGSSKDYRFSGELMEVLSDSIGVCDTTVDSIWTADDVRGYAIAGEYVFVSFKTGDLKKLDIKTGQQVKTVSTGVSSGTDYLTVGDDYVLDPASGKVYDMDLNKVYELGVVSDQAYFNDDHWYVVQKDKTCCCFQAADEDKSNPDNVQIVQWSKKLFFYIDGFTLTVSLAFGDKYLFYPGIGESDSTLRILYCLDKTTGALKDSFEMSEIKGTYWNSGFIHCSGDKVIVTTHWDSMFAPVRQGPDYKTIFMVDVGSDGKFKTDTAEYLSNGYNDSYGSTMVVSDGLGFIQTGLSFKVFDMSSGKIIASTAVDERLGKTYSNIAVAVGDDGFVRGYVSPAGAPNPLRPVDGLICFEYNKGTKEIRSFDLTVGSAQTDNTNSIKIGPNGEVVFAKNDGKLYCIIAVEPPEKPMDWVLWAVIGVVIAMILIATIVFFIRGKKASNSV